MHGLSVNRTERLVALTASPSISPPTLRCLTAAPLYVYSTVDRFQQVNKAMISVLQRASPVLGRISMSARPASMMGRGAGRANSCLATTQHLPVSASSTAGCILHFLPSAQFVASPLSSLSATLTTVMDDIMVSLLGPSILLIKRTFQPSILRKKRKHGFLKRHKSVGGRRVLKRRKHKGRARLGAG